MNDSINQKLKTLWDMKNITVDEFLKIVSNNSDFKFLLTTAGAWFLLRCLLGIWIGLHVLSYVCRIFNLGFN